jgi:hypothetical protein
MYNGLQRLSRKRVKGWYEFLLSYCCCSVPLLKPEPDYFLRGSGVDPGSSYTLASDIIFFCSCILKLKQNARAGQWVFYTHQHIGYI